MSKVAIGTAAESWKHLYEEKNFCHQSRLHSFAVKILSNF